MDLRDDAGAIGQLRGELLATYDDIEYLEAQVLATQFELQRLQDRLRLIGEATRVGIWEYDFELHSLYVSEELASIYGLEPHELTWPEFVSRLHPDDVVDSLVHPTPSSSFAHAEEYSLRVRHADGRYLNIRSRSITCGVAGESLRKLGVHIDMTEDARLLQIRRQPENR